MKNKYPLASSEQRTLFQIYDVLFTILIITVAQLIALVAILALGWSSL